MKEKKPAAVNNVFRVRNFRLVFFGALVSDLGSVLYSFAISFYILEISNNNAFLQGLYLALCGAVLLLFTPIGGVFGDRFNRAKIMFVCDYLKGGNIILTTLGLVLFADNTAKIVILFIAGILGNAIGGIFSPAASSLLPDIVAEDQLQQANAYNSAKSSLQSILGVVLAGVLYAVLPVELLFFIVGVCYVLSGVSEMFIRYEHRKPENKLTVKVALNDMRDGLRYLKTQQAILVLMITILFINFFISPVFGNFIPFFVKTDIAEAPSYLFDGFMTPELWSSVFSMLSGISMLVGSVIMSAKKQKEKCGFATAVKICFMAGLIIVMTAGYGVLVALGVSLNAYLLLYCILSLLSGYLLAEINIPINTVIMKKVDKDKLSKVMSIINILSQGLIPIASVIAGSVLQYLGSTALLIICSVGFTGTALFMLFNKKVREI